MLRLGCLLVLAFLACLIVIPVVASHYLPWWGTGLLIVAEFFFVVKVIPKLLKFGAVSLFMKFFGIKSKVLRNAAVTVHQVSFVPKPPRRLRPVERDEDDETDEPLALPDPNMSPASDTAAPVEAEILDPAPADPEKEETPDPEGTRYLRLDCTIIPNPNSAAKNAMQHWDIDDLRLIPYSKKISLKSDDGDEGEPVSVRTTLDGVTTAEPEGSKLHGPHRLEFIFRLPPNFPARGKLRYYFESFGDIPLPPSP